MVGERDLIVLQTHPLGLQLVLSDDNKTILGDQRVAEILFGNQGYTVVLCRVIFAGLLADSNAILAT